MTETERLRQALGPPVSAALREMKSRGVFTNRGACVQTEPLRLFARETPREAN
jgi:hypothetical protein